MTVVRVPVEAELREPEELEDGLGLPVDLGLLPLAVRRLSNEGLEAEPSGDGCPGKGCAVLVSDVHPEKKLPKNVSNMVSNKAVQSLYLMCTMKEREEKNQKFLKNDF